MSRPDLNIWTTPSPLLLPELQRVGDATRNVLWRLPEGRLDGRAHPRSRSLGEVAQHIAHIPTPFLAHLADDELDRETIQRHATTVSELLDVQESGLTRGAEALESLSDSQWMDLWRVGMARP